MIALIKPKWIDTEVVQLASLLYRLKNIILFFLLSITLTACGGGSNSTTTTDESDNQNSNTTAGTTSTDGTTNNLQGNLNTANEPIAKDISISNDEDSVSAINLPASDPNGDTLSYSIVDQPQHGNVRLVDNIATYIPRANYAGTDSFTFKVNDGSSDSNIATATIILAAVNDTPIISNNYRAETNEEQSVKISLLAEDADADVLSYEIVNQPSNGVVTLLAFNGKATATYIPNANYHGNDAFRFKVNDGTTDSNTATVAITVNAINDAPIANNGRATTDKNTNQSITLTATDIDTDNASLTYIIETQPEHGSVTLNGATVSYTPSTDYTGSDSFTFSATDGESTSNIATIDLTIVDAQQTMKILPLGDSITHTHVSQLSYRYFLWKLLIDQGSDFDFIGSRTDRYGSGTPIAQPDYLGQKFDPDHEGLADSRADNVLTNLDDLLQTYTPDVVLLHLGTNDILQGQSTASTVNELEGIIGKLRADNADVTIFLAKIIPAAIAMNGVIDLNNQLDDLANRLSTSQSRVIVVDMFSDFDTNSDTYDGTHPNQQGDQKMAQRWFDAMINNGIF